MPKIAFLNRFTMKTWVNEYIFYLSSGCSLDPVNIVSTFHAWLNGNAYLHNNLENNLLYPFSPDVAFPIGFATITNLMFFLFECTFKAKTEWANNCISVLTLVPKEGLRSSWFYDIYFMIVNSVGIEYEFSPLLENDKYLLIYMDCYRSL